METIMKELYTEIDIHAPVERVWSLITDLENYINWNPFIVWAQGDLRPGGKIKVRIKPPGAKEMGYTLRTLRLEREKEFRWLGRMFFRGILNGEHIFELQKISNNQVRLIHKEYFTGILVPFVWKRFLNTKLRQGFEELNRSLKITSEKTPENI